MQYRTCITLLFLLAAQGAPAMAPRETPATSTSGGITEIALERTWCDGCPTDLLVLHANGTAEYKGLQHAHRSGYHTGKFPIRQFDRLARWLLAEGFFDLKDQQGDFAFDAAQRFIQVTRVGKRKVIASNPISRSPKLWGMESVILAMDADIQWQSARSGIRVTTLWKMPGEDWRAQSFGDMTVAPARQQLTPSGKAVQFNFNADAGGRFEMALAPGTYLVGGRYGDIGRQTVVVKPGEFTDVTLRFDATPPSATNIEFIACRSCGGRTTS